MPQKRDLKNGDVSKIKKRARAYENKKKWLKDSFNSDSKNDVHLICLLCYKTDHSAFVRDESRVVKPVFLFRDTPRTNLTTCDVTTFVKDIELFYKKIWPSLTQYLQLLLKLTFHVFVAFSRWNWEFCLFWHW